VIIAQLTTDKREHFRAYSELEPSFGTAPEALLRGFEKLPEAEVHVLSCVQHPVSSPHKLAGNIHYHALHVPKLGWLRTGYQGCVRAVRRKLRELRPDIVHGQGTERECALAAVLSGFPSVVTIHGNMAELARLFRARWFSYTGLAGRLENFTLPKAAGVFCNSAYTEGLVKPRARRTWRVPNPIRSEFFDLPASRHPESVPVLVNVGVVCERKRQLDILRMAGRLHARGVKFRLEFIGSADASNAYAARFLEDVKSAGAAGFARYLGTMQTAELIGCFDRAGALIHFPTEEAFGLVVAEAQARGLKLFGASLGGITEIASGCPDAALFDAENWSGLSDAIDAWLRNGASRSPAAASLMRERYHPEVIARRHLEIYREVLSTRS